MSEHSKEAMAAADRIITKIDRKLWAKLKQINIDVLFEGVDMQKPFAAIIDEEFADKNAYIEYVNMVLQDVGNVRPHTFKQWQKWKIYKYGKT